tara:strand:+ start:1016 stop:1720 length:705 start_codon:yes stop_codon:yes gene_type:complete
MKYALWSGGFDSTYMVMKLLWEGHTVQPIYLSCIDKRQSESVELRVMKSIVDFIRDKYPKYRHRIKDFVKMEVKLNKEVEKKIRKLGGHGGKLKLPMGTQQAMFAHFCSYFPHKLYYGTLIGDPRYRRRKAPSVYLRFLSYDDNDCGFIDEKKFNNERDKLCSIFKNLRFPIINLTKEEMLEDSKNKKFDEVLYKTWSCWYPYRSNKPGEPCGSCAICKQRIIPAQPQNLKKDK